MNNYKNNFRRNRFKPNGDRHFRKRNGNGSKINGEFNNSLDFKRKNPGRNNQNASKIVDKYTDLAREALSNGDKIFFDNYSVTFKCSEDNYRTEHPYPRPTDPASSCMLSE